MSVMSPAPAVSHDLQPGAGRLVAKDLRKSYGMRTVVKDAGL